MAPRTSKANFCVRVSLILSVFVVCLLYVVIAIAGIVLATRKGNVTQVKLVAAVVIIVGIVGTITSLVGIYGIWKNKLEGVPKFALLFFAGSVVILHVLLMVMGFISLCFKPIIKTISLLDEKPHTIYQTAIKYFNVVGVFCFIAAAVTIVILILIYLYVGKLTFARFIITSSSLVLLILGLALAIIMIIVNPKGDIEGQKLFSHGIFVALIVFFFIVAGVGVCGLIAAAFGSKVKILQAIFLIAIIVVAAAFLVIFIAAAASRNHLIKQADDTCKTEPPPEPVPPNSTVKVVFDKKHLFEGIIESNSKECDDFLERLKESECKDIKDPDEKQKCFDKYTVDDVIKLLRAMVGGFVDVVICIALYVLLYLVLNVIAGFYNCFVKAPYADVDDPNNRLTTTVREYRADGGEGLY